MDKDKIIEIFVIGSLTLAGILFLRKRTKPINRRSSPRKSINEICLRIQKGIQIELAEHQCIIESQSSGLLAPRLLPVDSTNIYPNPMLGTGEKEDVNSGRSFMPESTFSKVGGYINANSAFTEDYLKEGTIYLVKGAPRREIVIHPSTVRAAIVTCGGLCPGLNVVIRELVMSLHFNYGTTAIYGIVNGYKGFYTEGCIIPLLPQDVNDIHNKGGTILKSSRGGFDLEKICRSIEENGFNQIFVIGGDGTHRGISVLAEEMSKRGNFVSIVGVPKTIDNDIPIIDKSFGFESSIEEAQRAINSADTEANSVEYGIGLVKLMGRNSGFIALHSSLSNRNVNLCLIPECEYELNGPNGVYSYIVNRLRVKGHAVIVVAEGAASGCLDENLTNSGKDASGNPILYDIGKHLKDGIVKACKSQGIDATLKYIDPTYMIRSVPANANDRLLCTMLAQAAVHGAFAGFTAFSVGTVAGQIVYIPVELMTTMCEGKGSTPGQRKVDIDNNMMWWRLMASTGQPGFRNR